MTNLAKALQGYYSREGKRVVFKNGQSLNQLALAMWEHLGFRQVDASVISRVINGERLFTVPQLKAFCNLLTLNKKEEEYLLSCLQHDYSTRLHIQVGTAQISQRLAATIIEELSKDAFSTFYRGNYDALEAKYDLVQQLATPTFDNSNKSLSESIGLNLYLKGRTIANGEISSHVIEKIYPIFKQLLSMGRAAQSKLLIGYAYTLMCTVYYLAGGYSDSPRKHRFYDASIRFAKKAIDSLPEDNHESFFALRAMVASAHYTHNTETIFYVARRIKRVVFEQPKENYINLLHVSMTLSKGLLAAKVPDPFSIQELVSNRFEKNLTDTGVYEVSAIKEEIDTLLLLDTQDNRYIQTRLKAGINLADEYKFHRQKRYFNKLLRAL